MRGIALLLAMVCCVWLGVGCRGGDGEMDVSPGAEWDLVVFGDSSAWGVGKAYAARIEEDLGVSVTVHDFTAGGEPIGRVLQRLREDDEVRRAVEGAEVIAFYGNPYRSVDDEVRSACLHCVDPMTIQPPPPYEEGSFDGYEADIDAVIDELRDLRRGRPTIVRAMDAYVPVHVPWREADAYDGCWRLLDEDNRAIHRACDARGIPVASVYDAFNGPDHHEDPRDKGYILSADGLHTSNEGRDAIGEVFRATGYEPVRW